MKLRTSRTLGLALALFTSSISIMSSCNKNGTDGPTVDSSNIMLVHAAPDALAVDLLVDGQKKNTDSVTYGKNTAYFKINLAANKKNFFSVRSSKAGTNIAGDSLLLTKDIGYTLYTFQDSARTGTGPLRAIISTDNLALPIANKAKIRLVHLVPDATNFGIDVEIVAPGTAASAKNNFTNVRFKNITSFIETDAGVKDIKLKIGGTTNPVTNLTNFNFQNGKIYTVVVRGYYNAMGARALNTSIITNN